MQLPVWLSLSHYSSMLSLNPFFPGFRMFYFLLSSLFFFFFTVFSLVLFCSLFPLQFCLSTVVFLPFPLLHTLLLFRTAKDLVTELLCCFVGGFFRQKNAQYKLFYQRTSHLVTLLGFSKQTHVFRLFYKQVQTKVKVRKRAVKRAHFSSHSPF